MKKWSNPELLNLELQETEAPDPRFVVPVVGYCTACGQWGIHGAERYNHRWIWTNFPFKGYYACRPGEEIDPPADDPDIS